MENDHDDTEGISHDRRDRRTVQKLARRVSRKKGLFAPDLLKEALKQSFIMLRPDIQWKNPVMFVVEIGTVLSILYTIAAMLGHGGQADVYYLIALDIWLFLTVCSPTSPPPWPRPAARPRPTPCARPGGRRRPTGSAITRDEPTAATRSGCSLSSIPPTVRPTLN